MLQFVFSQLEPLLVLSKEEGKDIWLYGGGGGNTRVE